jgi:alanine dehydrogenase
MIRKIGIRREDKNPWEMRVPLVPADVKTLIQENRLEVVVQPSENHRTFNDDEYREAGAEISEDLSDCDIIFGVKEIPKEKFVPRKLHIFFSHVIKGQSYNMPMLQSLMNRKCSLIDYEKIEDEADRRLIFFGRYAGLSGMVETLYALGRRLRAEGIESPLSKIKQPHEYSSLSEIQQAVSEVGECIQRDGLPPNLRPFVCGFTGYGNVSKGAQEIYDLLPVKELSPSEILNGTDHLAQDEHHLYKVVFYEKDMFTPNDPNQSFQLAHYFNHPDKYRSQFEKYIPHLHLLVNCIYWTENCPRLVTKNYVRQIFSDSSSPNLRVIGDISCDIEGSIEMTLEATDVDNPFYVYDSVNDKAVSDIRANGPVIMAIENLPCEIPREASEDFSKVLKGFVPELVAADFTKPISALSIPNELRKALIVYNGQLTADYLYIHDFLSTKPNKEQ